MTDHKIVFEFNRDNVWTELKCFAPEGADCRLVGDCGCEAFVIERDDNGTPFHTVEDFDGETRVHWMRDGDECNTCLWVNECAEELGSGNFTIAEIPVEVEWSEDGPMWKKVEA